MTTPPTTASTGRKEFKLDLDSCIEFPTSATTPVLPCEPGESWQILREVVQDSLYPIRPVYITEDIKGTKWNVAFYCDETQFGRGIPKGHIIAIDSLMVHHFMDGSMGYRIEDPKSIIVIPTNLKGLWKLNKELRDRSDRDELKNCFAKGCNNLAGKKCTVCQITRYCSSECQSKDWNTKHRAECKIIKTLVKWDRTDWG